MLARGDSSEADVRNCALRLRSEVPKGVSDRLPSMMSHAAQSHDSSRMFTNSP
jgi:hypothetical protein